jgi:hypothetical protein
VLSIDTDDFSLTIERQVRHVQAKGEPYLDWLELKIALSVPGINAHAVWSVMPSELLGFREQIQAMAEALKPGLSAELASIEPGFQFRLRMHERGAILGDFMLQPSPPDGARLQGLLGIDQSYLPSMLAGLTALLENQA